MENTYKKFVANVYVAKCSKEHNKGDVITVTTKYGKENLCTVHNLVSKGENYFYYSIVRNDGLDSKEHAMRKLEKLNTYKNNAIQRSDKLIEEADLSEEKTGIPFGQPILVGHHSEKKHRKVIERSHNKMNKALQERKKAEYYQDKTEYWEKKRKIINLSMPESINYYATELEKAKKHHQGLKDGSIKREHTFSLSYAKKNVNNLNKKYELALLLWG